MICGILCHILRTYTNENHKELFFADVGVDGDSCACGPVSVVYAGLDVAVEAGVFPVLWGGSQAMLDRDCSGCIQRG